MNERTVEKVLDFQASPERVWEAISDPAELSRWFGDRAEMGELTDLLGNA